MQYEISIENSGQIKAKIAKLQSSLMDWNQSFSSIGRAFKAYYSSVPFTSRGTIYGKPWTALNPSYKTWKADKYPGRPMLIREGDLSKGFDFVSTTNSVRLFNRVDYFEKHQKGLGVPQRIIMALNEDRKQAAVDELKQELARKVRAL